MIVLSFGRLGLEEKEGWEGIGARSLCNFVSKFLLVSFLS